MNLYLRYLALIVTIGGGFSGIVFSMAAFYRMDGSLIYLIIISLFIGLYSFIVFSGLRFSVTNDYQKIHYALMLQIPWVSSEVIAYRLSSAFQMSVLFKEGGLDWRIKLGSDFDFFLFNTNLPQGMGINLFALLVLILVIKYGKTKT